MTFLWFDILQLLFAIGWGFLIWRNVIKKRWKITTALVIAAFIFVFMRPVVLDTGGGWGQLEARHYQTPAELPERFTSQDEVPFNERVQQSIQTLKENRE